MHHARSEMNQCLAVPLRRWPARRNRETSEDQFDKADESNRPPAIVPRGSFDIDRKGLSDNWERVINHASISAND